MSIWPKIEHGGYATKDLVIREKARVTAASYLPGVRTPMHVHPHHDQCIFVVDGDLGIITQSEKHTISAGDSIIVSADKAHALESGGVGSNFISVFIGEGADQPGKTRLPNKLQRLIDPKYNKHEKIVETILAPEKVNGYDEFNEAEKETFNWIINRLLKRIENGRVDTTKWTLDKTKKLRRAQTIEAWRKDNSLFFWSPATKLLLSLTFKRGPNMHDHVKLSDIDIYRPALKNLPQVKSI